MVPSSIFEELTMPSAKFSLCTAFGGSDPAMRALSTNAPAGATRANDAVSACGAEKLAATSARRMVPSRIFDELTAPSARFAPATEFAGSDPAIRALSTNPSGGALIAYLAVSDLRAVKL